jgi:NAD(P)-dependent dehydrogenase (short-subunit alcohol dehydrogenase family)
MGFLNRHLAESIRLTPRVLGRNRMEIMRLRERVAIITGASSGIGRAIAIRFASEGARVVLSDLDPMPRWSTEGPVSTAEVIERSGGQARYLDADVTRPEAIDRLIAAALDFGGRLDVLVNNAGKVGGSSLLETTDEEWQEHLNVNLTSQFRMCRAAIAQMVTQDPYLEVRGRIINVSSQWGFTAPPGRVAYGVTKAGVAHLTRQLAIDYALHGIVVNALAPGRIITGTHKGEVEYLEQGIVDEDIALSLSRTPYPRLGRPEDVAGAALFLASDDCSFISGHSLHVDGGWTAC